MKTSTFIEYINNRIESDSKLREDLATTAGDITALIPHTEDEMFLLGKLGLYPADTCAPFVTRQGTPFYEFDNMAMMPKGGKTMKYLDFEFRQLEILFHLPRVSSIEGQNWLRNNLFQGCRVDARKKTEYKAKFREHLRPDWDEIQAEWMKYCLNFKYKNWAEFRNLLHSTDHTPIEDATKTNYPSRLYWGAELVEIEGKKYYFGCNIVGKLLVQLRTTQGKLPYTLPADLHIFGQPILPI